MFVYVTLRCKRIILKFLFWSICLSSFLVHFKKNRPGVFFLMRFLLLYLDSRRFLDRLRYSFSRLFDCVSFQYFKVVVSCNLFSLPSFASIFGLSPQPLFSSSCNAFSVSSEYLLMFRFSILACCRSHFICDSHLSSHSYFDFPSKVFKGAPIFSLIHFDPAYIKSFNSVMSFVGIFINKSFTFSVLDLTVLQSIS